MKITDLKVQIVEGDAFVRVSGIPSSRPVRKSRYGLIRVFTDEGIEGDYLTWGPKMAEELTHDFAADKDKIIGEDPLNHGKILGKLYKRGWNRWPYSSICFLDICLWDIVGKILGLPIYKLLGGCRDKLLAYGSTPVFDTDEKYIEHIMDMKRRGFKAVKLHPYEIPEDDIRLLRAVREAVGDDMILMHDPHGYDRFNAMRVGRQLDKLGYLRYEDPLVTTDLDGLVDLCRSLDLEVMMGEFNNEGIYGYTEFIRRHAADALRCTELRVGGITAMMKIAHLAECFGMNFEPHSFGNTHMQAASLHIMLAINNCDFFEMPAPEGIYDVHMKEGIKADKDGYVHAPVKPGLGYDLDWTEIEKNTLKTL